MNSKSEIQSLVCGQSLRDSSDPQSWKNLGLIHILVVSGGHLSILASLLSALTRRRHAMRPRSTKCQIQTQHAMIFIGVVLGFFSLANRLQPPVLRSLLDWMFRSKLKKRGWHSPEVALITTWIALPFCSTIFDLLSLALSFFASVTVEKTARSLHRHPLLALVALQTAVWWVLLPLLFTMGLPHPLTTMTNIILAPLLGATLIPLAMITWASGLAPLISGVSDDPLYFGVCFDVAWSNLARGIKWLASSLPAASSKINGQQPLIFGFEITLVLIFAVFAATCALLIRSQREQRREALTRSIAGPALLVTAGLALAILVHREITISRSGVSIETPWKKNLKTQTR